MDWKTACQFISQGVSRGLPAGINEATGRHARRMEVAVTDVCPDGLYDLRDSRSSGIPDRTPVHGPRYVHTWLCPGCEIESLNRTKTHSTARTSGYSGVT